MIPLVIHVKRAGYLPPQRWQLCRVISGSFAVKYAGNAQTESLPDVEHLTGSNHDDILAGDRHDNVIDGGTGNDDSGKYFRFILKLSTFHTVWFVCENRGFW